jgi:DNA-binding transcriptional LysR family regulator
MGENYRMADWQDLHHFLRLASEGSLSGAARALGVEHATIARRVAALEADLGVRLIDRRGRKLLLTREGERVAAAAARMETAALSVDRLRIAGSELDGEVTISVPPSYAHYRLMKPVAALRARFPGLRLRILGETRYASLDRREADIAIRLSRPESGDFTARKIGAFAMKLYASPDYLATHAAENWDFIAYDESMDEAPQQRHLKSRAGTRAYAVRATSLEMQASLVRLGAGIAMLPDFLAEGDALLVEAEPDQPPLVREVWIAVHSDLRNAPAIRAVMDALAG